MERVAALARELAPIVGADPNLAERAARLAKADLTSEMVVEFTSLQGVMGRYYALESGEETKVADAIRDHYKPQGPSDSVPTDPVSVAVALADKLDTLVTFDWVGEAPTGSKDPYALRRAAIGIIRLTLNNRARYHLNTMFGESLFILQRLQPEIEQGVRKGNSKYDGPHSALLAFFVDRLKVYLRDSGARHDLIDAVLTSEQDDLVSIVDRVKALGAFLETPDGEQLLAGAKRASNILRIEEKKDGKAVSDPVKTALFTQDEEKALFAALSEAQEKAAIALKKEDYTGAMAALAPLRPVIDAFFDEVTVNADDPALRTNRLALLNMFRQSLRQVADFDKIAG